MMFLIVGIVFGIFFNLIIGLEMCKWVRDMIGGGDDDFGGDYLLLSTNGGIMF